MNKREIQSRIENAWLKYIKAGDFEAAAADLRNLLATVPVATLEHVECQIEMAALYLKTDISNDAERLLRSAVTDLKRQGYAELDSADPADTLARTIGVTFNSRTGTDQEPIGVLRNRVQSLYKQITLMLEQAERIKNNPQGVGTDLGDRETIVGWSVIAPRPRR